MHKHNDVNGLESGVACCVGCPLLAKLAMLTREFFFTIRFDLVVFANHSVSRVLWRDLVSFFDRLFVIHKKQNNF